MLGDLAMTGRATGIGRRAAGILLAAGLLLGGAGAAGAAPVTDGVLGKFVGAWAISGTTRGEETATMAQVRPAFGGAFVELHIKDPSGRSDYEARVFLGQDEDGTVVAHWLDGTGGGSSRTLGTGRIVGDRLDLTFAYPEGEMRNQLSYDRAQDAWRMRIEMGPKAAPRVFSDWRFVRRAGR